MRIKVIAQPQQDFDQWIEQQQQAADQPIGQQAQKGEILFQQKTCGNCHTISGTPADGKIGPDLSHIASRETLLSGMMANKKENLRKWLENPQNVKKGSNMPNFLMSENEVNALVDYLEQLK
jgi:cytochrome c oxidase subunit II